MPNCQIDTAYILLCKYAHYYFSDVLMIADKVCSGHQECEFHVGNKDFEAVTPCSKDLKNDLEASYSCIEGKHDLGAHSPFRY